MLKKVDLCGVPITALETVFDILDNDARCGIVDTVLGSIPASDQERIKSWMQRNDMSWSCERYYFLSIALAEAAHRRGGITEALVREVSRDIVRNGGLGNYLNIA